MGIVDSIKELLGKAHDFFNRNPSLRAPFKTIIIWLVGYGIARLAALLPELEGDALFAVTAIIAALSWLIQQMQQRTTWPVVGSRARKR